VKLWPDLPPELFLVTGFDLNGVARGAHHMFRPDPAVFRSSAEAEAYCSEHSRPGQGLVYVYERVKTGAFAASSAKRRRGR
jgi:hypothetical protein